MSTFLSIDLDYFGMTYKCKSLMAGRNNNKKNILDFIDNAFSIKVPTIIVKDHHKILNLLNKSRYTHIINVDYHSDVVIEPVSILNEGTWANYYQHHSDATFEWRYPHKQECLYKGNGVCGYGDGYKKEWKPSKMGYKKIIHTEGIEKIDFNKVSGIGICISPDWYDRSNIDFVFKRFDILKYEKYGYSELEINK